MRGGTHCCVVNHWYDVVMSRTTTTPAAPPRLSAEDRHLWQAWVIAGRALTSALDRTLADEVQFTLIDYELLDQLAGSEEPRRMCDLGASVALTRSGATRAITRLERSGLVRRLPSPTDGRSTVVELTGEGRERQAAARGIFEDLISEHFLAHLDQADRETLTRTSGRFLNSVMGTPVCQSELAG